MSLREDEQSLEESSLTQPNALNLAPSTQPTDYSKNKGSIVEARLNVTVGVSSILDTTTAYLDQEGKTSEM